MAAACCGATCQGRASTNPWSGTRAPGATDRRWLLGDAQGSIIATTVISNVSIATNAYNEYGIPSTGNYGRFQYTGRCGFRSWASTTTRPGPIFRP